MQSIISFITRHTILVSLWIILFIMLIYTIYQKYFSKYKEISPSEAVYLMNKKNAIVIDVRNLEEYKKGHIVNSINIQLLNNNLKIDNIKLYKERPIITFCNSGLDSSNAANILYNLGFKNIYVIQSGMYGWIENNLPLI